MPQSPLLPEYDPQALERSAFTDPDAIGRLLDALVRSGSVFALHAADGTGIHEMTRLTAWDSAGIRMGAPDDERRLRALLREPRLTAVASLEGVRFQFDIDSPSTDAESPMSLRAGLPRRAYRLQRRDAYRVVPPSDHPVECVTRQVGDVQAQYRVLDLSAEGVALMLGPGQPTPLTGETWHHCRIEIPGYPPIACDLVVRFVSGALMGDGASRRVGCEFDRPTQDAQRALQVYVMDLQSGRYERQVV